VNPLQQTEAYKQLIQKTLSTERYHHSLAVADEAVRLAEKYGGDQQKAAIAGLLHDSMKDTSKNELLQKIDGFGIILDSVEKNTHKLWHAIAGAAYAKQTLGIKDGELIDAIRYHTTARADMGLLEKILYLADFTSADRTYTGVGELREAVDKDIDTAMRQALNFTISDLLAKNSPIHPDTVAAYNQMIKGRNKK